MTSAQIAQIRSYNRFYTGFIGLLDKYILNSKKTLSEVRILYEIYHGDHISASEITSSLNVDKGYLSRVLYRFEKEGLIRRARNEADGRMAHIQMTKQGKTLYESLNEAANTQIMDLLKPLSPAECRDLIGHMIHIRKILHKAAVNPVFR